MQPTQFGRYTLIRLLGRGGMAEVWLARDNDLGRQVALKLLPTGTAISGPTRERFIREARMMAQLQSPRIVTVFDLGVVDGRVFIAMTYVDGRSLAQEIEAEGRKPWPAATRDIREAALALRDAHDAGVIHRDVKPSNLMRGRNGNLVVVDFGLARIDSETSHLSLPGSVLGTPPFMSPEQCRGEAVDQRSDLYSLVCTYYALLVGRAPFTPGRPEVVIHKQVYARFPDPGREVPDLPHAVRALIAKGTAKEAAQRYQTADELLADLDAILAGPAHGPTVAAEAPASSTDGESSEGVYLAEDASDADWSWSDLTLTIQERTADGYPILVGAPQIHGRPDKVMELDLEAEPVAGWLAKVENNTCSQRDLQEFGAYLFGRLFPGDLATTYELSVGRHLDVHERRGLRITLQLLPASLQAVPWELAFQRIRGVFLGSEPAMGMSRRVGGPALRSSAPHRALRVLVCAAAPPRLTATDATLEMETVEGALRSASAAGRIQSRALRGCSRVALIRALDEFRPHIVHFVGHGETRGRVPGLLFEGGPDGEFVGGELLREILTRPASVRLAILMACRSGGLAHTLAERGIAAIGMLTDLANPAAVTFSRTLYRVLASGHAVDRAVNMARRAVWTEISQDRRDWFAPILVAPPGVGELFCWEARPARFEIDSHPRGARVFVDGEPTPHLTPAVVTLRHPGRHVVQVGLGGGAMSAGKVVAAEPGASVALHFALPVPASPASWRRHQLALACLLFGIGLVAWVGTTLGGGTDVSPRLAGSAPTAGPEDKATIRARLLPRHDMVEIPGGPVQIGFHDPSATVELLLARKRALGSVSQPKREFLDALYEATCVPPRHVRLPAFEIDRYEVTNSDYRAFLAASGDGHAHCHPDEPAGHEHAPQQWGPDDCPVTTIDWWDAYSYARWKGRRLPTEDEWELAARGPQSLRYPWGNTFDPVQVGSAGSAPPPARAWTSPRPGSACAMAGGVQEWTATAAEGGKMTIKGSSFLDRDPEILALGFARAPAMGRSQIAVNVGFRCARNPEGETPADMVAVPAASVMLGGETSPGLELLRRMESGRFVWDILAETSQVAPFRIDRFEVSNAQYCRFLDYIAATGDHGFCAPGEPSGKDHRPEAWNDPSFSADEQPVVGIDWWDAFAYANWAGKRLPRRAEWLRAARGDTLNWYPWGDALDAARCNCAESGATGPAAVSAFAEGASQFGVRQLTGNATEWTNDEIGEGVGSRAYVLGGGWNERGEIGLLFNHPSAPKAFRDQASGFRCAEDVR